MKLYERIENNNFDEIDRNRAIELIENGNGHLVYNENYFKLQKENEKLKFEKRRRIIGKYGDVEIHDVINRTLSNDYISKQIIKDKIEELNSRIEKYREYVKQGIETDVEWVDNVADRETVKVLQELLESEDSKDGENKKSTNTIRNSRT